MAPENPVTVKAAIRPGFSLPNRLELAAFLILMSQSLGLGKTYPWSVLPWHLGRGLWLTASAVFLLVLLRPELVPQRWRERVAAWSSSRAFLVLLIAWNVGLALLQYRYYVQFGYALPWALLVLALAGAFFVRRDRLWLSCLLNVGFLLASMAHFPLNPMRSDMLPAIHAALDAWSRGQSPYGPLEFGSPNSLAHYLPGTTFAHLPAWGLGVDLRWNELAYRLAWLAVLGWGARRLPAQSGWLGVMHLLVLSPYFNYRHDLYFESFLLLIVLYQAAPRWRWLLIPALVATRQWAWVMAPFLVLDWLFPATPAGSSAEAEPASALRRTTQRGALLAAGTVAVGATAWLLLGASTTWSQFLDAIFATQGFAAQANYSGDFGLTFAPLFFALGMVRLAQPLQALIVAAVLAGLAVRWRKGRLGRGLERSHAIHEWGLIALCVFMLLNFHLWNYFWISPALWMVAAAVFRPAAPAIAETGALG